MKKFNFRKRVFQIAKQLGKTISRHAQMYDVRDDFNKLKEKEIIMSPKGKGTYGTKVGRPPKKK